MIPTSACSAGSRGVAILQWTTSWCGGARRRSSCLNAFPYASGHVLVLPLRHVGGLGELTELESAELWTSTRQSVAAIEAAYDPDGLNVGANLGRAGGAGIPAHLHLHVLPRWSGDTNFMTTIAGARVMPETLQLAWKKLSEAWPA